MIKFKGKRFDNGEEIQGYYAYGMFEVGSHFLFTDARIWHEIDPSTLVCLIGDKEIKLEDLGDVSEMKLV